MTHRTAELIAVRIVTGTARAAAFDIRRRVFQHEQGVSEEEEFDTDDDHATHVLAEVHGVPVGTGRIVFHSDHAKIGRMAVLAKWRGRGVGRALMNTLLGVAREHGAIRLVLHAQVHAIPFYAEFGFRTVGEQFDEAGMPHRRMERTLAAHPA